MKKPKKTQLTKAIHKAIHQAIRQTAPTAIAAAALLLAQPAPAQDIQLERVPQAENPLEVAPRHLSTLIDVDGDGDLDAFAIQDKRFYLNTGNASQPHFEEQYDHQFTGYFFADFDEWDIVTLVDMDDDGDLDALIAQDEETIHFYRNTGSVSQPHFEPQDSPFTGVDVVGDDLSLAVGDIDNDGDIDVVAIEEYGTTVHFYQNTGSSNQPHFEEHTQDNPFADIKVLDYSVPSLVDIDNDGDLDIFINNDPFDGESNHFFYQNTGTASQPHFEQQDNPFKDRNQDKEQRWDFLSFSDIDSDGDLDAFASASNGFRFFFYQNTGSASQPRFERKNNPLKGVSAGLVPSPTLADIDNDGDLDAFIISYFKTVYFYQNTGSINQPRFEERDSPLKLNFLDESILDESIFVDIDNDGDLDAFIIIIITNAVHFYQNTGSASQPRFEEQVQNNPFKDVNLDNLDKPEITALAFGDIDNDGDQDVFIGTKDGSIHFFKNTGNASQPYFEEQAQDNPLKNLSFTNTFVLSDFDNDEDLDLVVDDDGSVYFYQNIGSGSQPYFERQDNPLVKDVSFPKAITLGDIDNDGDQDVFIGNALDIYFYQNTSAVNQPNFVEQMQNNPFKDIDVGRKKTPTLIDIDNDGDKDMFIGTFEGSVHFVKNTGSASQPHFEERAQENPFKDLTTLGWSAPDFADLDNDGDYDAVIGYQKGRWGGVLFYQNTGTISEPRFENNEQNNPFADITHHAPSPSLVDIDSDGDYDAFIGNWDGRNRNNLVYFYQNTGSASQPHFEKQTQDNPLADVSLQHSDPTFIDIDNDGDLDVFVGELFGKINFYQNTGSASQPRFEESVQDNPLKGVVVAMRASPTFADIDNDGDVDAIIGSDYDNSINYFVNTRADSNVLPDNHASLKSGSYSSSREINLRCLDCSQIYYTLDGTEPTLQSTELTAPFVVAENTTVKFFTVNAQGNQSEIISETYIIDTVPPEIQISSPTNQALVAELTSVQGTASDLAGGSQLERIELQLINDNILHLTDKSYSTFSRSNKWLVVGYELEEWSFDLSDVSLPLGKYTIRVRAIDRAKNVSEDELTIFKLNQAKAELAIELNSATLLNDATLNVKGSLISKRFPQVHENIAGLPIELTITAPDGSTQTEKTEILSDIGQYEFNDLSDFTLEGTYTLQTHFAGNKLLTETASSQQTVLVGESAGYAIIIQGKIENEEGLESHNKSTNRIYQVLKQRGFEDANIFYFNSNPDQEGIEIDGQPTVADFVTHAELHNRINGSPAPFYLIIVDHGDPNGNFYINDVDLEFVTPQIWADWLNTLEAGLTDLSKPRIIMLGYCFSGKTLEALSKPGRIIVSSATANEESYKGPKEPDGIRGGEYFMDDFFKNLGRGESFRQAFEKSSKKTKQFTTRGGRFINIENEFGDDAVQHPLIDANGDKKGSNDTKLEAKSTNPVEIEPLYNLSEMFLGAGADYDTNYAGNPADIIKVAETIYLASEQSAAELSLTANEVWRIKEATVNVRLPSTELELADTKRTGYSEQREIAELVEINLLCDFSQQCLRNTDEVSPDLFTDPGKYDLFYFVVDNETNDMSPIHRAVVYKNKPGNQAPAEFSLLAPATATKTEATITFTWQSTTDPDNDPITYTLIISEDYDFHTIAYQNDGLRKPELTQEADTVLEANTTYYWKVEAVDYFGAKVESGEVFGFSTE